jgi:hypothetical protein
MMVAAWYVWLLGTSIWNGVIVALPIFDTKYVAFSHDPMAFIVSTLFYLAFVICLIFFGWSLIQPLWRSITPTKSKTLAPPNNTPLIGATCSHPLLGTVLAFFQRPVALVRIDDVNAIALQVDSKNAIELVFEAPIHGIDFGDICDAINQCLTQVVVKARKDHKQFLSPVVLIHIMPTPKLSYLETKKDELMKVAVGAGVQRVDLSFHRTPPSDDEIFQYGRLMR